MTDLKEDKSNLEQDPCGSAQNSALTPGKVAGGQDLSCGGSVSFAKILFLLSAPQSTYVSNIS